MADLAKLRQQSRDKCDKWKTETIVLDRAIRLGLWTKTRIARKKAEIKRLKDACDKAHKAEITARKKAN